jgi:pentatricopeptide repeat protein
LTVCVPLQPDSPRQLRGSSKIVLRFYERKAKTLDKKAGGQETSKTSSSARKTGSDAFTAQSFRQSLSSEIKGYNVQGEYTKAMEVWDKARENSAPIDEYAYATILATFRHLADFRGAVDLYTKEILPKGIRNSFIDSQILDCYAKMCDIDEAKRLFYEMLSTGIEVKPYAFYSLITGMLISGDENGDVIGLLTQYGKRFSEVDKNFWSHVVTAFLTTKGESPKQQLLKYILETSVVLQPSSYVALLNHFMPSVHKESRELADQLIAELKQQGANGIGTLIMMYAEKNDVKSAMELWKEIKPKAKLLNHTTFTQLIVVCAACGYLKEVEEIHDTLTELKLEVSSAALAAMVRLYASNLQVHQAKTYFDIMLTHSNYISPFLFNSMLDMYSDVGDTEEALRIVKKMEERSMKPNVSIYNSLIALHLKANQAPHAIETYQKMVKEKLPLNFITYKTLLSTSREILPDSLLDRKVILKKANASDSISEIGKNILKQIFEGSSKSI